MSERCHAIRDDGGRCRGRASRRVQTRARDGSTWILLLCWHHVPWFTDAASVVEVLQ